MMNKKKIAVLMMCFALVMTGCSSVKNEKNKSEELGQATENVNTEAVPEQIVLNVNLGDEPEEINLSNLSSDSEATIVNHLFAGLARWVETNSGTFEVIPDLAVELPEGVKNADGTTTYTYTLREGISWSDGKPVTANDFVYAWNKAAANKENKHRSFFSCINGFYDLEEGSEAKLAVTAKDDKTLEVVLSDNSVNWNEYLAFTDFVPCREDISLFPGIETCISNGAFVLESWNKDKNIVLKKNPEYYNSGEVFIDKLDIHFSDNFEDTLSEYENGNWLFIDDIPQKKISSLKTQYTDELEETGTCGSYYLCWNVNSDLLSNSKTNKKLSKEDKEIAKTEIRKAISLLLDRTAIAGIASENAIRGGQIPASSFIPMGLTDSNGTQFYKNAGSSSEYSGYFDAGEQAHQKNVENAIDILKKYYDYDEASSKFVNTPIIVYLYNTGESHMAIASEVSKELGSFGIDVRLKDVDWTELNSEINNSNYSIAKGGCVSENNDPTRICDLWSTIYGSNYPRFGEGDNQSYKGYSIDCTDIGGSLKVDNGTWSDTYDKLMEQIHACEDKELKYKLIHKAEDMVMDTGCIVPLYYYTDIYLIKNTVEGFYCTPTGEKCFTYCKI